jgi:hypothetical protein
MMCWFRRGINRDTSPDSFTTSIQSTSTHTNDFQVLLLGLPPIPATNNSVLLPEEHWEYVVKDYTIAFIRVGQVSGGGIAGILEQLGVDIPIV